jgi:dTDP-4-amino-4,6-dideoxygalactose transaminase
LQVPYFRPDLGDDDIRRVTEVLRSGWLTTGAVAKEFEREFCRTTAAPYAVAVNSCTNGLHAALVAVGIQSGDEVITTPLTFCGTVRAIEEAGATPVFVDIGDDLNLDPALIESAITPRTRAILPVHLAGLPCDLSQIRQLAREYQLKIVEDAAHAFGAAWRGEAIGASEFSTAVFSFYANKNLTTGEGGMITNSDPEHATRLRRAIGFGLKRSNENTDSRWQYEVVERGFKYNLCDVLAAIGLSQLAKAAEHARRRDEIAEFYHRALSDIDEIELPPTHADARHAWHLYILRLRLEDLTVTRDEFVRLLADRGVATSVHFRPIPMHSWFAHYGPMEWWPRTQREFPRLLSLPLYPTLTEAELHHVANEIHSVIAACRKSSLSLPVTASYLPEKNLQTRTLCQP